MRNKITQILSFLFLIPLLVFSKDMKNYSPGGDPANKSLYHFTSVVNAIKPIVNDNGKSRNDVFSLIPVGMVSFPPDITTQPVSQSKSAGDTVMFFVAATGSAISYQWKKNGDTITGATNDTLILYNIIQADAGDYTCVLTNTGGSVTSDNAHLTVYSLNDGLVGYYQFSGNANDGSGYNYHGTVSGAGLTTDRFSNSNEAYSFNGGTNQIQIPSTALYGVAQFSVSAWFYANSSQGSYADIIKQDVDAVNTSNPPYAFYIRYESGLSSFAYGVDINSGTAVTKYITPPSSLNWHQVALVYDGQYMKTYLDGTFKGSVSVPSDYYSYDEPLYIGNWNSVEGFNGKIDDVRIYNRSLSSTEINSLYHLSPIITVNPISDTLMQGNNVTFSVTALGDSLTYQWQKNDTSISGANAATYTINGLIEANTGYYRCIVSNPYGIDTSTSAYLHVDVLAFTSHPANQNRAIGDTAMFSVTTTGTSVSYQWQKNGTNLTNDTNSVLRFYIASVNDTGTYRCIISNPVGGDTSHTAYLHLLTLDSGLVAYYPFSGNAHDTTGHGHNGTVNGATLTTDRFGNSNKAYDFDGTDDFIHINDDNSLSPASLSLSFWVYHTSFNNSREQYIYKLADSNAGTVEYGMGINPGSGDAIYMYIGSFVYEIQTLPNLNSWNFICGTYNSSNNKITIYLNGSIIGSTTSSSSITNTTGSLNIGWGQGPSYNDVKGKIDDIRIYNRYLTAYEISQLYCDVKITGSPASQTVCAGQNTSFTVTATGSGSLTYQWKKNGTNISGATSATYSKTNCTLADTGYYSCLVTNASCSMLSDSAHLDVTGIVQTVSASRCGPGTVTLKAFPSAGTTRWYTASTGGTLLASDTVFTTNSLTASTTYYVTAYANGCASSPRVAVTATIKTVPVLTSGNSSFTCDSGTVTLTATATLGTINWYDSASGGSVLHSGNSYTTPVLYESKIYYIDATYNGCTTAVRWDLSADVFMKPSIVSTAPASRCGPGTVTLQAKPSTGIVKWYTTATTPTVVHTDTIYTTPSLTATTNYYVAAYVNGCYSPRTTITATINAIPAISSVTSGFACDSGSIILRAATAAGTINWYNSSSGGSSFSSGTSYTTPVLYTSRNYFVDVSNNGCTSPARSLVTASIYMKPSITGTVPASRCGTGSVTLKAKASSGQVKWYSTSTTTVVLYTDTIYNTPSLTSSYTYYVAATENGCYSARTAVPATITATPAISTVTSAFTCDSGSVVLRATAVLGTINWYNTSTGGTSFNNGTSYTTPVLYSSRNYFVDVTNNGCTSSMRSLVTASVYVRPTITSTVPASRCGAGTLTLRARASSGLVKWYSSPTVTTVLYTDTVYNTPSLTASYTYYVAATENGCYSARTAVPATVTITPAITSVTSGFACDSGAILLKAVSPTGTIKWYNSASGGSSVYSGSSYTTPVLYSSRNYYVDATLNSCTSPSRSLVSANVYTKPSITSTVPASRCGTGSVTLKAKASSGLVKWYSTAITTAVLYTDTIYTTPSLTASYTYYVAATENGCYSARTAVPATVSAMPAITSVTSGLVCDSGTVLLKATTSSGTINWYSAPTGGSSLGTGTSFTTPLLRYNKIYYVDAVNGGCIPASRTAVTAEVNKKPFITNTVPASRCGAGIVTLRAKASTGVVKWYASATTTAVLYTDTIYNTPSLTTTYNYYVAALDSGCYSPRSAVAATILTIPTIRTVTPGLACDSGAVLLRATSSAGTINWYSSATGGTSLGTGTSFTTPLLRYNKSYYVDASLNGCTTATRTSVTAEVNKKPFITNTVPASRCGGGMVTLRARASTGVVKWFSTPTTMTALYTDTIYTTPSLAATTNYYVAAYDSSCYSARTTVTATIFAIPTIRTVTSGYTCDSGTVNLASTASAGTINWYSASTGGSSLGTGTAFTTPKLYSSANYYVAATSNGCTTTTRSAVAANVYAKPSIISTVPDWRCGAGTVTLKAKASTGVVRWYSTATTATILKTDTIFTTPSITTTTNYYAGAYNNGCVSTSRSTVTATIRSVPTITSVTNASRVGPGTVNLSASASAGTINWYDTSAGGSSLGTGTSFTTPSLTATKTYYVDATNNSCTTTARTAVTATILPVMIMLGVDDKLAGIEVKYYPNPATDVVNVFVSSLSEKATLCLSDIQGRIIVTREIMPCQTGKTYEIDLSNFEKGLYYLSLKSEHVFKSGKLVKY